MYELMIIDLEMKLVLEMKSITNASKIDNKQLFFLHLETGCRILVFIGRICLWYFCGSVGFKSPFTNPQEQITFQVVQRK